MKKRCVLYRNKNTVTDWFGLSVYNLKYIWNVMKVEAYFTNIWLLFLSCWLALKHSYGFFTLIFAANRLLQSVGGRVNLCSISLYPEHTCLPGIKLNYFGLFSLRFLQDHFNPPKTTLVSYKKNAWCEMWSRFLFGTERSNEHERMSQKVKRFLFIILSLQKWDISTHFKKLTRAPSRTWIGQVHPSIVCNSQFWIVSQSVSEW